VNTFAGFSGDFLPFFRELHERQDHAWFVEQKARYEAVVRAPMRAFVETTNAALAVRGVPLSGDPRRSVSRINRDVRFSADKRVYKDHTAATFARNPGEMSPGLLYVQLGVGEAFAGIGFYFVDPDELSALRRTISDQQRVWLAVEAQVAAAGYPIGSEESLKRMPRGFEAQSDSSVAEALRRKAQTCRLDLRDDPLDAGLPFRLADFALATLPLLTFGWQVSP
jgi:uncharacterized protein (TIGR02453 family)